MALDLRSIARKATIIAEIMENKEKGITEELIELGKPVTINDCELCQITNDKGEPEQVWVFTIKEIPNKFFFGGYVVKKIFESIVEVCAGDYTELYSAVSSQGLKVKFGQSKTKDGKRTVTTIEVI